MLLKNVKVMWSKIGSNPDDNFDKNGFVWTIDCLLSPEQKAELLSEGRCKTGQ